MLRQLFGPAWNGLKWQDKRHEPVITGYHTVTPFLAGYPIPSGTGALEHGVTIEVIYSTGYYTHKCTHADTHIYVLSK